MPHVGQQPGQITQECAQLPEEHLPWPVLTPWTCDTHPLHTEGPHRA